MTENKTLDEYINGQVTDVVYLPTDVQAVYDCKKLALDSQEALKNKEDQENILEIVTKHKELNEKIAATADKVTIRGLSWRTHKDQEKEFKTYIHEQKKLAAEEEGFDEELWRETFTPPVEKTQDGMRALASIVSVETHDGKIVYAWEKDEEYWIAWLNDLAERRYVAADLLIHAVNRLFLGTEAERMLLRNVDFLS